MTAAVKLHACYKILSHYVDTQQTSYIITATIGSYMKELSPHSH